MNDQILNIYLAGKDNYRIDTIKGFVIYVHSGKPPLPGNQKRPSYTLFEGEDVGDEIEPPEEVNSNPKASPKGDDEHGRLRFTPIYPDYAAAEPSFKETGVDYNTLIPREGRDVQDDSRDSGESPNP